MNPQLIELVTAELARARSKYPSSRNMLVAVMAEAGEVCTAANRESPERIREEIVQLICTAARLWEEGDPVLNWYRMNVDLDLFEGESTDHAE